MSSSGHARKRSDMTIASAVSSAAGFEMLFELFGLIVPSGSTEKRTVHRNP